MVKPKQAGKVHNYPNQRKGYSTSRSGVGGRKRITTTEKQTCSTYFDKWKKNQVGMEHIEGKLVEITL